MSTSISFQMLQIFLYLKRCALVVTLILIATLVHKKALRSWSKQNPLRFVSKIIHIQLFFTRSLLLYRLLESAAVLILVVSCRPQSSFGSFCKFCYILINKLSCMYTGYKEPASRISVEYLENDIKL